MDILNYFNCIKRTSIILLVTTVFFNVITLSLDLSSLHWRNDGLVSSDKKIIIAMFVLLVVIKAIGFYGLIKDEFFTILIFSTILFILWIVNLASLTAHVSGKAMNVINDILTVLCVLFSLAFTWAIRQNNLRNG